jgi:hypothetical protein
MVCIKILSDCKNKKLLWGVQMLHGAVFSKRVPLAAGGKVLFNRF